MRQLRPEGHTPTPKENQVMTRLLKERGTASRGLDMSGYLETNIALLGAACDSYARHLRDPASSPEIPGVKRARSR